MRWLWEPISLVLFPPTCGSCAAAMVQRSAFGLCDTCFSTLKRADGAGFKAEGHLAYAAYRYQGAMRALVRAAKFAGREDLACALGELLAADPRARVLAAKACCIVPVPLAGPASTKAPPWPASWRGAGSCPCATPCAAPGMPRPRAASPKTPVSKTSAGPSPYGGPSGARSSSSTT
jgi:hypothetical protein